MSQQPPQFQPGDPVCYTGAPGRSACADAGEFVDLRRGSWGRVVAGPRTRTQLGGAPKHVSYRVKFWDGAVWIDAGELRRAG
jgi:hypothetical protein